jgi:hypothetical protein
MHGSLDRVVLLDIELGEGIVLEGGCLTDITQSGGIYDVADGKALDGLVLGDRLCGRYAPGHRERNREKKLGRMKDRLATDIERTCGVQLTATAQVNGSTRQMACGQAATGNVYFPISLLMNIPYAVNVPPAVLVAPVISSFLQSKRDGGGRKQKGLQTSREEEKVSILALI